jgi:activating signal cointegrator complex subunit 2
MTSLPPIAPFPPASVRNKIVPEEWEACLDAWLFLTESYLRSSDAEFSRIPNKDESVTKFLTTYAEGTSPILSPESIIEGEKALKLWRNCFLLSHRFLSSAFASAPTLLQWTFLADISSMYARYDGLRALVKNAWERHESQIKPGLLSLKNSLAQDLERGDKTKDDVVQILRRFNPLLHASPEIGMFTMIGSDLVDSLHAGYRSGGPELRTVLVATTYLGLSALINGNNPNLSLLHDHLYSLKTLTKSPKVTSLADASLLSDLITNTPILGQIQDQVNSTDFTRAKSLLSSLEGFRGPDSIRRRRPTRRKANKGKSMAIEGPSEGLNRHGPTDQIHVHQMSLITQIQDLFPELGSGFVAKLLDEYADDVEKVTAHLLEDTLPPHLQSADRKEELGAYHAKLSASSTPPFIPERHNVFDDDDFDRLAIDPSRVHMGSKNANKVAEDILQDRTTAPSKAAILSALAAFDSDDDERDDTYDADDVGGTVDPATLDNNPDSHDETADDALFRAWKASPVVFGRDAATRRSKERAALKEETKMSDEAIEGWALMLGRDPPRLRRLEAKFSSFSGVQRELISTKWTAGEATSESDADGGRGSREGFRGRGRRGRRGRGGAAAAAVTGSLGEKEMQVARQRKQANKGSQANHNRRDQRAKKMARGGFAG